MPPPKGAEGPNTKTEAANVKPEEQMNSPLGNWSLEFPWILELGAWGFSAALAQLAL